MGRSTNLFKFISFTERISKLRIDVVHKIEKRSEIPEDCETFFQQCLTKWTELNCSLDFQAFYKEISSLVKSLSLLVYHQKTVVEILQRYLSNKDSLALDALLELCVELSRDLQGDFSVYFSQFLNIIAAHLDTKDAQKIEDCFKTLAYLFKFQWRFLVKDMKSLFRSYSPLLSGNQAGHIDRFAAESFAFLVRKTKNLPELFDYIFSYVLRAPQILPGIARLLSETVRGSQNRFHSCTENVVMILLSKLAPDAMFDSSIEQGNKIFEVFVSMFEEMAKYTKREYAEVIWACLVNAIDRLLNDGHLNDDVLSEKLKYLVQLTGIWTEWKQGALIFNAAQLQKCACRLIKSKPTSPLLKTAILKLTSLILLNSSDLDNDQKTKLINLVFKSKHFSLADVCHFSRNVKQWPAFTDTLRPKLVSYFEEKMVNGFLDAKERSEVLFMLAEIVVDVVSFEEGYCESMLAEIGTFSFSKMAAKNGARWWKILFHFAGETLTESEVEIIWASLVALPFMRPLNVKTVGEYLVNLFYRVCEEEKSSSDATRIVFLLSQTVKCISLFCKFHERLLEEILPYKAISDILRTHSSDVHVLQAFHVYLSVIREQSSQLISSNQNLVKVYECVEKNLASHARLVRLLTLKILASFEQMDMETNKDGEIEVVQCSVFEDCLQAELVPLTFHEYRRKLIFLQKLAHSNTRHVPDVIREGPLRYLIAMLYLNLSTMWDPIMTLITTYAVEENKVIFWKVFHEYLGLDPWDAVKNEISAPVPGSELSPETLSIFFQRKSTLCIGAREDNRVDRHNFRLLLWKTMEKFPQIVEARSRQVVPLFLDFVRKECSVIDEAGRVSYQDLTRCEDNSNDDDSDPIDDGHVPTETDNDLTEVDNNPSNNEHDSDCESNPTEQNPAVSESGTNDRCRRTSDSERGPIEVDDLHIDRTNSCADTDEKKGKMRYQRSNPSQVGTVRPVRMKTLTACLTLFGLFKNPRTLYQEPAMRRIYLTLLTQKDGEIQKLALACLMTYKFEYLVPYKENLDRLMEDKTFRDELTSFSSDEELNVVIAEHRSQFTHILIRLLYGRMQRWTGAGTRGKAGSGARRSLVLRFLNSCHGDEMNVFIDLISCGFKEVYENELSRSVVSLTKVVPLRKQLGFLNMFLQLIAVLGSQATQFLPRLLQILFYCLGISKDTLEHREKVDPRYLSNLRTVRQLGIKCLTKFFERFPHYDFSSIIDEVFELAVTPQISKLRSESLQSPTSLLRLLNVWSKTPRFHALLAHVPAGSDEDLLSHVFACLTSDHVCTPVITMVMEMAERLLSGASNDQLVSDQKKDIGQREFNSEDLSQDSSISIGTRLVLPHIATILGYLNKSIKRTVKDLSKAKGKLSKISPVSNIELSVLSKISPFIVDPENSLVLVRLMLPILNASEKKESQLGMLKSIASLLRNVQDPRVFFGQFSKLFSSLHGREARSELCEVFSSIAQKTGTFVEHAQLLHGLNSWNKKQLDEPDFETRLDSFSRAAKLVQEPEATPEGIVPLLLNATYTALNTSDMALRYSAIGCVKAVVDLLSRREDFDSGRWFDVLVVGCLLPAVKEAVKSKTEGARNEFVLVLGTLVKKFDHPTVNELKPLTSEDAEVDFFENIVHIQVHRRIRALRRFTCTCAEATFSNHTLSSIMLPLVTHFVYDYKSVKDHNVVTEAINAISAIARQLSWPKYSSLLRHYLRLLPREKEIQKVLVRIVVCILESFHFDLTSLQEKDVEGQLNNVDSSHVRKGTSEDIEDNDDEESGNVDKIQEDVECPLELKLKIHSSITTKILPQLHKCLTKKIESNDFHRLSGRKEDDNEEILRVPIILAMVKLLQSLPKKTLETTLPGLLIRVCQALKSRAFDVRETARDTLSKTTNSLGIYYFPFILNELRSSLIKGYQLHVLGATLYFILNKFEEHIPDGGLDVSIRSIVEILIQDLFGEPARERDVDKIATKLPEARNTKSFESFELVAKKISASKLVVIITPMKEVLDETQNHKISIRAQEVLRRISIGLQKNTMFLPEQMLVFVHSLVCERLPLLEKNTGKQENTIDEQDPRLQPSDTYLIPSQPSRGGKAPEVSHRTNTHVLITFGLQLLLTALKRQKLVITEPRHAEMLDPFVAVLTDALNSKHVKITTIALRCLCWVVKFPLPSLKKHVVDIASRLFKLLKLHARTGGASGDNYEMVLSAFKAITVLIRDFTELKVTERQLRILLTFVEEDIHDYTRQSSAFPLLKAILSRKLQVSEINDVMLKVAELSVTDQSSSVRLQCRQVLLQYLLDYPLGKKLKRYLEFFISQLEYEQACGRESTLEMLVSIVSTFPEKVVFVNSGLFFLPLCTRLVNDESVNCRKLTAVAIKALLEKLDVERRDHLFGIVQTWLKEDRISLERLACHVCGLFVEVESQSFDRRLPDVLPSLFDIIKPDKYNLQEHSGIDLDTLRQKETVKDHLLINALMTLTKILQTCSVLTKKGKACMTAEAWDSILSHLTYPHTWVRLMASRLFGLLFSQHTPEDLIKLSEENNADEYMATDLAKKASELCEAFLEQLKAQHLGEELSEQIVKNMFYLSKLAVLMNKQNSTDDPGLKDADQSCLKAPAAGDGGDHVTITWLLTKMCNIAKYESSQTPKLTEKRFSVFRWIAAVGSYIGSEDVGPFLTQMLKPVYRELDGGSTYVDEKLRELAQEVAELFKNLVGHEVFSQAYTEAKQSATEARAKRKMQSAFEMVANPEASVAKKIKRNIAKKENRKRKLDRKNPSRKSKKMKTHEVA